MSNKARRRKARARKQVLNQVPSAQIPTETVEKQVSLGSVGRPTAANQFQAIRAEEELQELVTVAPRSTPANDTAGVAGLVVYDGMIENHERNFALRGDRRYITFTNLMVNVPVISAGVRFYNNLMRRAKWRVEPANDTQEARDRADFVRSVMDGMDQPWSNVVVQVASAVFYGFSINEMVAKERADGKVGLARIASRPQFTIERWDLRNDEIFGVVQRSPQTNRYLYIERSRLIHNVDDTMSQSPEGLGMLRHLVEPAKALRGYEILEERGFDTDLRGVPVGYAPFGELRQECDGMTEAETNVYIANQVRHMQNFIRNYRKSIDASLLLDSGVERGTGEQGTPINARKWALELLRGDPTTLPELAAGIERKNREMARIMGVEMILLGSTSSGSLAMSQDKSLSFGLVVDTGLEQAAGVLQRDFLGYIADLNGWDREDGLMPTLKPEKQQFRSVQELASALQSLALAGSPLVPGDPAVNDVRDQMGISRVPEDLIDDIMAMRGVTTSEDAMPGVRPSSQDEGREALPSESSSEDSDDDEGDE